MEDTIVPVFIVFIVFGFPVAAFTIWRVLAYKERIEMIRHGYMPPPVPPDPGAMRRAMRTDAWQPGPPMAPGMYGYDPRYGAQHQLRRGIQVAFIGFAILIGLSFIHPHGSYFGPWLLGGLIPMFVGIAQIVSAILSGAQFGNQAVPVGTAFGPREAQAPPPPPAGSAAGSAPPPPPGSYGGWRPGSTPEIEKPAGPPDYRG